MRGIHYVSRKLLQVSYWGKKHDKFLEQVDNAIDVFEKKFPVAQALFLFDNAPSHRKCSDDSLSAEHMNVRPGGKQISM